MVEFDPAINNAVRRLRDPFGRIGRKTALYRNRGVGAKLVLGHFVFAVPYDSPAANYSPNASPDGRVIAFSSDRDGRRGIWLKEVASGSEVPVMAGEPDDLPRLSPRWRRHAGPTRYTNVDVGGDCRRFHYVHRRTAAPQLGAHGA